MNLFKHYKKKSGTLYPFSLKKQIPFKTKRIFFIYGKKNFTRGDHAHYRCSQFFVPIFGKIEITYESKNNKQKIILDYKKISGLIIKPKTWCKVKFLTNNSILMVFCDREYEFNDYIETYNLFKKIIKKSNK